MKKKLGFTVVELLIVMLLISILVFLTLRVGDSVTANSRITGLMNNFLADFSAAKLLASSENRYVAIAFSNDSRSYTLQKQTDVSDYTTWTQVKTVTPFSDRPFCNAGAVSNFAVNSTGEVRVLKNDGSVDISVSPAAVTLVFIITNNKGSIEYQRTIQILPYGGIKVEKK